MDKIKCPNCGKEVDTNTQFCEVCGVKINNDNNSRMKRKNYSKDSGKGERIIDEYTIGTFIRFVVLYVLAVIFLGFGIFMAVLGTEVWLVIVIFLASLICFGIASYLLKKYLHYKKG